MPGNWRQSKPIVQNFFENCSDLVSLPDMTGRQLNALYDKVIWSPPAANEAEETRDKKNLIAWIQRNMPDLKDSGGRKMPTKALIEESMKLRLAGVEVASAAPPAKQGVVQKGDHTHRPSTKVFPGSHHPPFCNSPVSHSERLASGSASFSSLGLAPTALYHQSLPSLNASMSSHPEEAELESLNQVTAFLRSIHASQVNTTTPHKPLLDSHHEDEDLASFSEYDGSELGGGDALRSPLSTSSSTSGSPLPDSQAWSLNDGQDTTMTSSTSALDLLAELCSQDESSSQIDAKHNKHNNNAAAKDYLQHVPHQQLARVPSPATAGKMSINSRAPTTASSSPALLLLNPHGSFPSLQNSLVDVMSAAVSQAGAGDVDGVIETLWEALGVAICAKKATKEKHVTEAMVTVKVEDEDEDDLL